MSSGTPEGPSWVRGVLASLGSPHVASAAEEIPLGIAARAEILLRGISVPTELAGAAVSRQEQYLGGRLCAGRALVQAGSQALCGRSGEGTPVWPAGFVGSIAHTTTLAIAVAAPLVRVRGLGVDIEYRIVDGERLLDKVGTTEEQLPPAGWEADAWATLVFSAKESLYKALNPGVGRFFGYSAASIGLDKSRLQASLSGQTDASGEFSWELHEDLGPDFPRGKLGRGRFAFSGSLLTTLIVLEPLA